MFDSIASNGPCSIPHPGASSGPIIPSIWWSILIEKPSSWWTRWKNEDLWVAIWLYGTSSYCLPMLLHERVVEFIYRIFIWVWIRIPNFLLYTGWCGWLSGTLDAIRLIFWGSNPSSPHQLVSVSASRRRNLSRTSIAHRYRSTFHYTSRCLAMVVSG